MSSSSRPTKLEVSRELQSTGIDSPNIQMSTMEGFGLHLPNITIMQNQLGALIATTGLISVVTPSSLPSNNPTQQAVSRIEELRRSLLILAPTEIVDLFLERKIYCIVALVVCGIEQLLDAG